VFSRLLTSRSACDILSLAVDTFDLVRTFGEKIKELLIIWRHLGTEDIGCCIRHMRFPGAADSGLVGGYFCLRDLKMWQDWNYPDEG
jgi:hypothetical protein